MSNKLMYGFYQGQPVVIDPDETSAVFSPGGTLTLPMLLEIDYNRGSRSFWYAPIIHLKLRTDDEAIINQLLIKKQAASQHSVEVKTSPRAKKPTHRPRLAIAH